MVIRTQYYFAKFCSCVYVCPCMCAGSGYKVHLTVGHSQNIKSLRSRTWTLESFLLDSYWGTAISRVTKQMNNLLSFFIYKMGNSKLLNTYIIPLPEFHPENYHYNSICPSRKPTPHLLHSPTVPINQKQGLQAQNPVIRLFLFILPADPALSQPPVRGPSAYPWPAAAHWSGCCQSYLSRQCFWSSKILLSNLSMVPHYTQLIHWQGTSFCLTYYKHTRNKRWNV